VPLAREGISYLYEPGSGPADRAPSFRFPLRPFLGARQELEQYRLELDQCALVFLGHDSGRGVYLQVLALGFEVDAAFLEIVVEAPGIHRMISSRSRDR
jgi:hypothetical protein